MPRATANIQDTEKKELKTCEGAYVLVRRLTYGEKLERRAMVSYMEIQAQKGQKDFSGQMQLVNEKATLYDFEKCVMEHNLEDENGTLLNLSKMSDVKRLDPRIGEEIDQILSDLNNFEDDEGN